MRKIVITLAVLFVALITCGLVYMAFHDKRSGVNGGQHLANGAPIRLANVEFKSGTHLFDGRKIGGAPDFLRRIFPPKFLARFGFNGIPGSMSIGGAGLGTNLCAWTYTENSGLGASPNLRMIVRDEIGNSFQINYPAGVLGTYGGPGIKSYTVDGWAAAAFPRRGKTLTFSCLEQVKGNWQHAADFTVPNPAKGIYPEWTAEGLPATRTNEDLTITLLKLESGLCRTNLSRPAYSNETASSRAEFQIIQAGRETNSWRPKSLEIWDATGNHWLPYPSSFAIYIQANKATIGFDDALWPGESAWKMRFEFSRVADFAPEEICIFTNINLPGDTEIINLSNRMMIGQTELKLRAITGYDADQPGDLKWRTVKKEINISVLLGSLHPGERLSVVGVVDDSGRQINAKSDAVFDGSPEELFSFKPEKGARSVSMILALHKSRYAEFLVRPEFPTNAQASAGN